MAPFHSGALMKSPRKRIAQVSAKQLAKHPSLAKSSSTILRSSSPSRSSQTPIKRSRKAIRQVNPVAKAKRTKKYKAYLSSAAWKAKRQERFRLDGWRCVAVVCVESVLAFEGEELAMGSRYQRCPNVDETRTGKGLVCDHLTYARFGNENLDDLRTLCKGHDRRETVLHRANWSGR